MPSGLSPKMSFVTELSGKSCLVIGAGVTGRAVHEALLKFGALSKIFDENCLTRLENGPSSHFKAKKCRH